MNKKLTMVSVTINGKRKTVFTGGEVVVDPNGKQRTVVSPSVIDKLTSTLYRGQTYSIG